ncbi:MAG: hypothetical protein ACFFCS_00180, partial [Candidatus Hodarchaeota archaeon]
MNENEKQSVLPYETSPSTSDWATVRLDGVRIGCYAYGGATNPHTRYNIIVSDLNTRGANVTDITSTISSSLLANYDILWFDEYGSALLSAELDDIEIWVQNGGVFLITGDDLGTAVGIMGRFNITLTSAPSSGTTTDISPHPITTNVSSVYFGAPMNSLNLVSQPSAVSCVRLNGYDMFAAMEYGTGRFALLIDEDVYTDSAITNADNHLIVNNTFGWLGGGNNYAPNLTLPSVNPGSGNQNTSFNFSVTYTDQDNNAPSMIYVSINGTSYQMSKVNSSDGNYTDGCLYQAIRLLQPGIYEYYFNCSDGRFSNATTNFTGLVVNYSNSFAPEIQNAQVSPLIGGNTTVFNFSAWYYDADNNNPAVINVTINGSTYSMNEVDLLDDNCMDGKQYYYLTTLSSFGNHSFQVNASDGTYANSTSMIVAPEVNPFYGMTPVLSLPTSGNDVPLGNINFSWNSLNVIANTTYRWQISDSSIFSIILNESSGIIENPGITTSEINVSVSSGLYYWRVRPEYNSLVGNWSSPFSINLYVNDYAPALTSGSVNPPTGDQFTNFNFSVIYTDPDDNAPVTINVVINGTNNTMQKVNSLDTDYTDGCTYQYITTLVPSVYEYSFNTFDLYYTNETMVYTGLNVIESNSFIPYLVNSSVTPSSGVNTTSFNFTTWYFDVDNNMPAVVNISINGSVYNMTQANPGDTIATDGILFTYSTNLDWGYYQFNISCFDGGFTNSTGWISGPEVNPFLEVGSGPTEPIIVMIARARGYVEPALYDYLNASWALFGDYEVIIDYTTLNIPTITYTDLVNSGADVIAIPDAYGTLYDYTVAEANAIMQYIQTGKGVVSSGLTFYNSPDNNVMAPLFGLSTAMSAGYVSATNTVDVDPLSLGYASTYLFHNFSGSPIQSHSGYYQSNWLLNTSDPAEFAAAYPGAPVGVPSSLFSGAAILVHEGGMTGLGRAIALTYMCNIDAWTSEEYQMYYNSLVYAAMKNKQLGASITLLNPANNTGEFNGNINFSWSSLELPVGQVNYTWQISNTSNFSVILNETTLIPETPGTTNITSFVNYSTGLYYWRVRATYNEFESNWSDYHMLNFTHNDFQPELTSGMVNPSTGNQFTNFNFTVVYTDLDNDAPISINVSINGTRYAMVKVNSSDVNYTDGCLYQVSTQLFPGIYDYFFETSDGRYLNDTSTITGLNVSILNTQAPSILSPSVTPSIGSNSTVFNFSAVYSDVDNNLPVMVNITINGTTYNMSKVNPLDTNATDGIAYQYLTTLDWGYYVFEINVSDAGFSNSTGLIGGPEVNPFIGSGTGAVENVAIFKDADPWGYPSSEDVCIAYGISYTVYGSASFASVDLSPFDKVIIAGSQASTFYTSFTAQRTKFESYVSAGGILEMHMSTSNTVVGLPGGYDSIYSTVDDAGINASHASHPIVSGVDITDFDAYSWTAHNYLTNVLPGDKVLIYNDLNFNSLLVTSNYGSGLIIITGMTVEYAYGNGYNYNLLENMILYSEDLDISIDLLSPTNNSQEFAGNVNFSWTSLELPAGDVNYTWQISNTLNFSVILNETSLIPETPTNTSTLSFVNYSSGIYYWRVQATYDVFQSNWSDYFILNLSRNDYAPELTSGSVDPPTGNQLTTFNFTVTYTDNDNDVPVSINVSINGTRYVMSKVNTSDTNYTDGCVYEYSLLLFPGVYNYTFETFDGLYTNSTITYTGLTVVILNTQAPSIVNASVTPILGDNTTLFNFTAVYVDIDNNLPQVVNITINSSVYPMNKANASDVNATDGILYFYSSVMPFGMYQFQVNCS